MSFSSSSSKVSLESNTLRVNTGYSLWECMKVGDKSTRLKVLANKCQQHTQLGFTEEHNLILQQRIALSAGLRPELRPAELEAEAEVCPKIGF